MCPRCAWQELHRLATSPVPDTWEVWQCTRCLYTWRTTEPARRSSREAYPERFRMTQSDIDAAPEVPTVPPLAGDARTGTESR